MTALVAVLLLAAPLTAAHGSVSFAPPYTTFTSSLSGGSQGSVCAKDTNPTAASWSNATGLFQYDAAVRAGPCATTDMVYEEAFLSAATPTFPAPVAGAGTVYVELNTSYVARAQLTLGSGAGTWGDAQVTLSVTLYVLEVTHRNSTVIASTVDDLVDQSYYQDGSYSASQSFAVSLTAVSATFAAGHTYQVSVLVTAFLYAESGGGGTRGAASLDLAGSHGLILADVGAY
jgi:hypothetical protein